MALLARGGLLGPQKVCLLKLSFSPVSQERGGGGLNNGMNINFYAADSIRD